MLDKVVELGGNGGLSPDDLLCHRRTDKLADASNSNIARGTSPDCQTRSRRTSASGS